MNVETLLVADGLSDRDRALVALAAAGISRDAIAELRLADLVVWPASGTVLVRLRHRRQGPAPSSSARRFVLLEGPSASAVARYLAGVYAEPATARIFRGRGGRPLSPTGVYYVVRRVLEERAA